MLSSKADKRTNGYSVSGSSARRQQKPQLGTLDQNETTSTSQHPEDESIVVEDEEELPIFHNGNGEHSVDELVPFVLTAARKSSEKDTPKHQRRFTLRAWMALVALALLVAISSKPRAGLTTTSSAGVVTVSSKTISHYKQDRPVRRLGTDPALYEPVHTPSKIQQRIQDMELLEQVRSGHCGRFQEYLAGSMDTTTHWHPLPPQPDQLHSQHCINGEAYRNSYKMIEDPANTTHLLYPHGCRPTGGQRHVCHAPHPTLPNVTVTIDRSGPYTGTGGYDWTSLAGMPNVGGLRESMRGRTMAFWGGLVAPVDRNGTLVGYPPLHIHHAHIYPYGDRWERGQKIAGSYRDHHDLLLQAHGDSECLAADGGMACLLTMMDPGMVRVIENTESGLSAEYEINDVRPKGSDELEYYFEVVVLLSPYNDNNSNHDNNGENTTHPDTTITSHSLRKSTFMGLINPCIGSGPCTYALPLDPHSNLLAYHYTHGEGQSLLSSGYMSNFMVHSHQTMMDSIFVFLSKDAAAYDAVNAFREDLSYPLILECLHDGQYDLESAKVEVFRRVHEAGAQLLCEATKPSLLLLQVDDDDEEGAVHAYDKRTQLNCRKGSVPLEVGDVLTVVAFNQIHPQTHLTRTSSNFLAMTAFGRRFQTYQHTIFRFDLSYGNDEPEYIPPAYFRYCDKIPKEEKQIPINNRTGCPESIQYGR